MVTLRAHLTRASMVLLLAGALAAIPMTAHARLVDRPDPRGDVTGSDEDGNETAAGRRANGDIIHTIFRHKNKEGADSH